MAPLSKNKIKYIHSLEQKKIRKEERVFLAEGPKLVGDLLEYFPCRFLAATSLWLQSHPNIYAGEIAEVSQEELSRASLLKTPQQVLAILEQPQYTLTPDIVNPEKPDVPLNKNDAFQKVQKRRVQEKR